MPPEPLSLFDMLTLAPACAAVPAALPVPSVTIDSDMRPSDAIAAPFRVLASGWKARALDNLAAVRLARELVAADRAPTAAEAEVLAKFIGFGATELAQSLFPVGKNPVRAGWEEIGRELHELVDERDRASLARSTQYAHFTPDFMTRAIWDAVVRLGFTGGGVLEPGCGVGLFLQSAPENLPLKWIAVEIDPTTALVAKALHHSARIVNDDFRKIKLRTPADLAIGNPPFAQTVVTGEGKAGKLGLRLHDYFIARSLELVRPGGLAAFVTSHGTMDKGATKAREYLGSLAELLGAVRLPQAAMMEQAGTEVVVDVLFFRRLEAGQQGNLDAWRDRVEVTPAKANPKSPMFVNRWFAEHPEMVLGEHAWVTSPFGPKYSCTSPDARHIEGRLIEALQALPDLRSADRITAPLSTTSEEPVATTDNVTPTPLADVPVLPLLAIAASVPTSDASAPPSTRLTAEELALDASVYRLKEGSYCLDRDGELAQFSDHYYDKVAVKSGRGTAGIFAKSAKIIRAFVAVRNALRVVIVAQADDQPYVEAQARLVKAYNAFVTDFGPINLTTTNYTVDPKTGDEKPTHRRPNLAPFLDDPDCWLVASIEKYDIENDTAEPGPIFTERVVRPLANPVIDGPDDALAATLDALGRVDVDHIAGILGVSREEAIAQLGDRIYSVPNSNDVWVTADEYLSGQVRVKLAQAKGAAAIDGRYQRNVAALEAAQPADLNPSDVTARLGSPWIPVGVIEDFVREVMEIETTVTHESGIAAWDLNHYPFAYRPAATSEWGTVRRHAGLLLLDALNAVVPQIFDTEEIGGSKARVLNPIETEAAQEKQRKIKDAFSDWVWKDVERATTLMRIYNDSYNDIVPRSFDGSHLRLRNAASNISLYDHQKRVIWRIISSGTTYIAHAVGAGKSYSIAAAVMEQRRLGLVTKPLIAVPGHCLAQFSREFLQMYPTANLLVADESNFAKEKRDRFIARATTGDWDCIIITHSAFKFIPTPPAFEREMIEEQVASIEVMLDSEPESRTRKQLEQRKESLMMRFEALRGAKDDMVSIAEMGIDQIIVDEAQNFRKLSFITNTRNSRGIDSDGSQRAWDLYVKSRYVATRRPGRSLLLASGTPITNTLGEMFTIQRFMAEDELRAKQIHEFDAWSSMFGETATELELQPSGKYKPVTRFAEFINVPELVAMFRTFADVVQRKDLRDLITLPVIATGGRQIVTAEATYAFKQYQKHLGNRIDEIERRHGKPQPGDDIILSVITDGRHAAVDMRLVDREAENEETNKLNRMIDNVFRIWKESSNFVYHDKDGSISPIKGAVQMIFADIGTVEVGKMRGFSAYEWIRERLIALGVPGREIAFMQDYKRSAQKQALFNALNSGKMRILIGSSETMGTGVNAQRRLKALHHLDVPWLPSQIEQREGRIERQGNENETIEIYAYATPGSMDAPMWQTNERKARFIGMAMSGDKSIRRLEDAASQANSFAVAKAIASGNPLLMQKAGLEADIARLKRLRSAHLDDQHALNYSLLNAKDRIRFANEHIAALESDLRSVIDTSGNLFRMTVFGIEVAERAEAGAYLDGKVTRLPEHPDGEVIGRLGGFDVVGRAQRDFITNGYRYSYGVVLSHRTVWVGEVGEVSGNGLVKRLERAIGDIPKFIEENRTLISLSERKIADAQPRIGLPFEHAVDLEVKLAELATIEAQLVEESRLAEKERRNELATEQAAKVALAATASGAAPADVEAEQDAA